MMIGTSSIGVIVIKDELVEHWAQGYHRDICASSRSLDKCVVDAESNKVEFQPRVCIFNTFQIRLVRLIVV